ncbi:hypothetical protein [Aquimarina sp. BL5]|nr:hypothetical protein [Aquimarina sp. BL5]
MNKFLVFLTLIVFVSCNTRERNYEKHLEKGLKTFPYTRNVNQNLITGVSIRSLAFIKKSDDQRMLVIKLNDEVTPETINKFSLAIHTYLNKDKYGDLLKDKDYISTPLKPVLKDIKGHKYIITEYDIDVERIKELQFFLFDRDKFRKVLSKRVIVRNIGI